MRWATSILVTSLACAMVGGCSSGGVKPSPSPENVVVKLTWTSSVEAEDGTPVTDLSGYRLEWRSPASSPSAAHLDLPASSTRTTLTLPIGSAISVTAVSASRGEARSNEVTITR